MASNGKVPGTFVSQQEMNDLGKLLSTMRDYIISHEARLEAVEAFILESYKAQADLAEVDALAEAEKVEADAIIAAENEGLAVESTDDSSEG